MRPATGRNTSCSDMLQEHRVPCLWDTCVYLASRDEDNQALLKQVSEPNLLFFHVVSQVLAGLLC
jgi:hypothetical protein